MAFLKNGSQYYLFILLFCLPFIIRGGDEYNYKEALTKSILFFEGQRSGELPPNQRLNWRADSALYDGNEAGVDLTGGYYDSGDNVKFNFPMAFTMTTLSWSVIEFGSLMERGDLDSAREAIKWGTDYLLKCASQVESHNKLYSGVGDPNKDHSCWERPEDMDTPRTVYRVTAGSDLAGEIAAALAAASIVFRKANHRYSEQLRNTAEVVMQFATNNQVSYGSVDGFYQSYSGFEDELLWGAAWLYKATNKTSYRNYITSYGCTDDVDTFGWDSKFPGAYVVLAREYLVGKDENFEKFKEKAETFMCKILRDSPSLSIQFTGGGMMYNKNLPDSPLQYVTSLSFLITTYAKYLANRHSPTHKIDCEGHAFNPKKLRNQAKAQVDYILGTNPMKTSYMVDYGPIFPERVHHRAASSPSVRAHPQHIACGVGFGLYLHTYNPNPNTLTGAIVGGPDWNDVYLDDRSSYSQSEPATYINAPLVGILAYFAGKKQ
ncbi:endoglucanase 9 [Phtheirospermum japonicum]|uniref:Endoglucanase n=1 Tax=Phtheirospermum japonicum TaxID=374723 RepID=A0A830DGT1_9LAMI|nr:endoglucanase 9 [Phtheirospermum japonicum]